MVIWHARGAKTDERTCERMRGGGDDEANILCTVSRSDKKGEKINENS